jgi:hypothetical protein
MLKKHRKDRWNRLSGDVEFVNISVCFCSPKIPKADPAIGEAAKQNADIAASMRDIAKDQLAWERERADKQDPLVEKVVNQQLQSGQDNADRATEQWNIYKTLFQPMEQRMVDDANNFDSPERQDMLAAQAGADTSRSYQAMQDQNAREMGRLGVNPNSGKFAAITNETGLAQAKDTAGAMNSARQAAITQGMALRQGAAQFGRNMPATGLSADSTALNAGNSAVGNLNASNQAHNASMNSAAQWFGGAQAGNSSAANIGLGLYQGQLQGAQMKQDALSGIGSLIGTLGMAGGMAMARKGGVIKNNSVYGLSSLPYVSRDASIRKSPGGLSMLRRKGYAEGGMIDGPGTGTSDSIPATIEGVQPIRVSNGEAVLNKAAVDLVGEDFVHRINAGGLAMLAKKGPPQPAATGPYSSAGLATAKRAAPYPASTAGLGMGTARPLVPGAAGLPGLSRKIH